MYSPAANKPIELGGSSSSVVRCKPTSARIWTALRASAETGSATAGLERQDRRRSDVATDRSRGMVSHFFHETRRP
jgi:hypothetical protein